MANLSPWKRSHHNIERATKCLKDRTHLLPLHPNLFPSPTLPHHFSHHTTSPAILRGNMLSQYLICVYSIINIIAGTTNIKLTVLCPLIGGILLRFHNTSIKINYMNVETHLRSLKKGKKNIVFCIYMKCKIGNSLSLHPPSPPTPSLSGSSHSP